MDQYPHKKQKSTKKTNNIRKSVKKERALFLSHNSIIILVILIVVIGSGLFLFQIKTLEPTPELTHMPELSDTPTPTPTAIPESEPTAIPESEPTATPEPDEHPGVLATDFSLIDLDGNPFKLSDYKGNVIVIDFMATWCGPCRMEMPHYGTIWENYDQLIVIMSIDIDPTESEQTLRDFSNNYPYATWIWARDTSNLLQSYQITAIPTTVIIDQDGYIRFTHVGVESATTFIQEIDQLLF